MPSALFRCDASSTIGGGHLSRCLALAEALSAAGWRVGFATDAETAAMVPNGVADFSLLKVSGDVADEAAAMRLHHPEGVDLLVVDHYQRDLRFESACREFAQRILVMDDATGRKHDCDLLVDAAAGDRSAYSGKVPARAALLLGPAYALVRRSFVARRSEALRRRDRGPMTDILVSFGATDPSNVTPVALDALASYAEKVTITVALSSHAPHLDEVRGKLSGRMRLALDADMTLLMSEADLAIGAAGVTSYERAVLGLPSIIVTLAENQREIFRLVIESGAAIDGGKFDGDFAARLRAVLDTFLHAPDMRIRMTKQASALVDDAGSQRIVSVVTGEIRPSVANTGRLFAKLPT
jgi:UDP-2,4-diacetamido-2,4,6-trideoxy-beta-L-altropyranose hydrolase